jgi:hypothetical protein
MSTREDVLIGGNHLANYLIGKLGGGFASEYPPTMSPLEVLEKLDNDVYDVWCGWAAIMRFRDEQ